MIYNKPRDFVFKAPAPEKEKKQKKQKLKKESSITEVIIINQKPKREEIIKIASFFITLYLGTVLAFIIPLRPTYSESENISQAVWLNNNTQYFSEWSTITLVKATGKINIKIPPRVSSGQSLRLKKLGLPDKNGNFGELKAKIKIVLPKDLTNEEIELYKKLDELRK